MILFFTSANAFDEKITFAAPEDLPPKIYNENGELKGMYVAFSKAGGEKIKYCRQNLIEYFGS
jgi:hypothetical protein